jgi:hypothetical protein
MKLSAEERQKIDSRIAEIKAELYDLPNRGLPRLQRLRKVAVLNLEWLGLRRKIIADSLFS